MPPPPRRGRPCDCCIVLGQRDEHTAVRMCPHCITKKGEEWYEADADLLLRQVTASRTAHDRICTKNTRAPGKAAYTKNWKRR